MKSEKPRKTDLQRLSADDVHGALRVLQSLQQLATAGGRMQEADYSPERLVRLAKCIREIRKDRSAFFEGDLFAEASWDILLLLYISEREQHRMKVSAVCSESGVPETTALRWIDRLIELGMIRKIKNHLDQRICFVELTPDTLVRMDELLLRALRRTDIV